MLVRASSRTLGVNDIIKDLTEALRVLCELALRHPLHESLKRAGPEGIATFILI